MRERSIGCDTGSCLRVIHADGRVQVTDTKNPDAVLVSLSEDAWEVVLSAVRVGLPVWSWLGGMEFDTGEKNAFEKGVLTGEFDLKRLQEDDIGGDRTRAK